MFLLIIGAFKKNGSAIVYNLSILILIFNPDDLAAFKPASTWSRSADT